MEKEPTDCKPVLTEIDQNMEQIDSDEKFEAEEKPDCKPVLTPVDQNMQQSESSEEKPDCKPILTDDADYSAEVLREILAGNDCKIDDPELIIIGSDTARKLACRTSPLALINVLIAKWKHTGKHIQLNNMWETKDVASNKSVWNWKIGLVDKDIYGQAGDFNKQRAR